MTTGIEVRQNPSRNRSGYLLKSSVLLLIAFATAFFPRIIEAAGLPSIINFIHFAIVPLACGIVLIKTQARDKVQISVVKALLGALFLFLGFMLSSALLNSAGLINVAVDFLLLTEPFILLTAIVCVPFSPTSFKRFRTWILGFALTNLLLALAQKLLISAGILAVTRMTMEDNVQGVFYLSGGGHVPSAFVSLSFGLYYLFSAKLVPIWIRLAVMFAAFMQMLFADVKQSILVFLVSWVILILLRSSNIKTTLQYVIAAVIVIYAFYWCVQNLAAFAAFKTWIRPEIYGPDGDATVLKTAPFHIIPSYYTSFLNWFLGLGPGHTVGRLGGWMIKDYGSLLNPLGATSHPASEAVWATWRGNYLDSSFFSPLWGWAGIWGDLGFCGLGAYLYIGFIVWRKLCLDDFSRVIVLTIIVNGFIFTQLEEPAYMLAMAALIGLRWHELYSQRQMQKYQKIVEFNAGSL